MCNPAAIQAVFFFSGIDNKHNMTRRLGSAFTFSANLISFSGEINSVNVQLPFQKTAKLATLAAQN